MQSIYQLLYLNNPMAYAHQKQLSIWKLKTVETSVLVVQQYV